MKMIPEIKILTEKKLIGMRAEMSFAKNTTGQLWSSFMPKRKEIVNAVGTNLYSLQFYSPGFFVNFDPQKLFVKWAAIEVGNFDHVPAGMQTLVLQESLYAVFYYKGNPQNGTEVFQYILGTWLPASEYELDQRPHFELLGAKYKNDDPDSEEEIWIPVRKK